MNDGAGELLNQLCDSILWCDTATAKDLERFDVLRVAIAQALKTQAGEAEEALTILAKVRAAVQGYYLALNQRVYGYAAIHFAFGQIEDVLGMQPEQGATLKGDSQGGAK